MDKKIFKKVIIEVIVFSSIFGIVTPLATTVLEASSFESTGVILEASFDAAKLTRDQLKSVGLFDEEIDLYLNSEKTGITVHNGVGYDKNGNLIKEPVSISSYGKLNWAVKAIRKGYNRLPGPVKKFITSYTSLGVLLRYIDHFTGAVEDAIYWACISVGMPSWMAWIVAKALTLLL